MEKPECYGELRIKDKPCAICPFFRSCRQLHIDFENGDIVNKTTAAIISGKAFSVESIKGRLTKVFPNATNTEIERILTRIAMHPNVVVVKDKHNRAIFKQREKRGEIM